MKKKFFAALALILAVSLPLAACGGGDTSLNILDDNYRNWYEVFVRSYCDSGEDGVGDLKGLTGKLGYISEMGYNGIWLMPVCESTTYHGYDVVDYCTVESDYGTNEDMKTLVEEAHARGIRIIVDMVFNHTSGANAWFKNAVEALRSGATGENAKYIDYYNFSRSELSGYLPVSGAEGWYYEAQFDSNMPDLNLDSEAVRAELKDIMEFWLTDMDCDGFRLDACTSYYTGNTEKNVAFLKFVNDTAKSIKQNAYIVGEVWLGSNAQIRQYYESGIDSCFLFPMSAGASDISSIKALMGSIQTQPGDAFEQLLLDYQSIYDIGTQAPFLCNHDTSRAANMFAGKLQIKMGAGLLSLMNGNVFVYYGDEIGMRCADPDSDPTKRIAMRWSEKDMAEGQVFIPPQAGVAMGQSAYPNGSVESQQDDPTSILNYYKAAMRLRNRHPELARGTVERVDLDNRYVAAFTKTYRGSKITVLVNLSDFESFEIDVSGYGSVQDILDAGDAASAVKGTTLTMQPYSIAIFR